MANIFSHVEFYEYLDLALEGPGVSHTNSLVAAFSALLYVGGFIGCCLYPLSSSRFGRRIPLGVGSVFVIVGGALQAGAVHNAMMCVARVVTGIGIGHFLPGCPLYQAEVAPAHNRGFLVGLHAGIVGAGFTVAQWIGVAFFHVNGQAGWRVPLAIQCVSPLALLCIIPLLPESPRWLYLNGRVKEAEQTLVRLHQDRSDPSHSYAHREFQNIKAQLDLEAERKRTVWEGLKDPHMRKRFIFGFLVNTASQSSGSIVILMYGLLGCLFCLVMSVILSALYSGSDNDSANSAATFFIFLFVCFFAAGVECPSFVYSAEIFPAAWRASGVGVSLSAVQIWSAILNGAAAIAFENIKWKFYLVFICFTTVMALVVQFFFPETKGLTLEQISKAFGDVVVEELAPLADDASLERVSKQEPEFSEHEVVNADLKTSTLS
ncbi:Sugar transporter family protein [Fonsecaea pedrosoi]|nr:Sugar transporter family protein [Fonsecaea pedrosoi]